MLHQGTNLTVCSAALCLLIGCGKAAPTEPSKPIAKGAAELASAADAAIPEAATTSASGLVSLVLAAGRGDERPTAYDKVRVDFTAWNTKGEVVDGTIQRGGAVWFEVSGVIAGLREALLEMRVGERRRLWIPDQLVYPGRPGYPRPMALFELEVLEISRGLPPRSAPADVAAAPADATRTKSGLAYKWLTRGAGAERANPWDRVSLHYAGWTPDGALIDSSRRERPSTFDVDKVLPGWSEALALLAIGDKIRLWVPESLAYRGRVGEPRGDLVFELELASIERRREPPRAPAQLRAAPKSARRTKSGLAYQFVAQGPSGAKPTLTDHVEVDYSAWTGDGKLFDSSVVAGAPKTLPVSRLIPGWAEGLQLMGVGDKARFWIPEALAYAGKEGAPRGMLVYEVELLSIAQRR